MTVLIESAQPSVAGLAVTKLQAERMRTARDNDQVGRLVHFLYGQYLRVEPTSGTPDSYASRLFYWLADEVLRGYASSELDRATVLERFGEEMAMGLVSNAVSGWGSNKDSRRMRMLKDFAQFAEESSSSRTSLLHDKPETVRIKIALRARVNSEALAGAYDRLVDGDLEAFEALAIAMTRIVTWWGGDSSRDELEFDRDMWQVVLSEEVRARMAPRLTAEFDEVMLDENDVTPETRRQFAIRTARASGRG